MMSGWRSSYRLSRQYVGPLRAAILDWSGTVADKYVLAPAVVFQEIFTKYGVPVTMAEVRGPMGIRKDLHILALTQLPSVRQRWHEAHGRYPDQNDVDKMFADSVPLQLSCLRRYAGLLPGCAQAVATLKTDFGMKIGSTTGFYRSMVDILLEEAKTQGYEPDATVAGDEVINGARPQPHMIYKNLDLLNISPIQAVVKVDDTVCGIYEANEAGCWSVGVARWSNYMDIDSFVHEENLTDEDIETRLHTTRDILVKSGAHYVVDSIADLPEVVADINQRLAHGEKP